MERQTKHRILGILVIIGLVIILLPLFQGGKEISTETALVKAPPFPDQPVQVVSTTPEQQTVTSPSQATITKPTSTSQDVAKVASQQPDDVISVTHPTVVSAQLPAVPTPETNNAPSSSTQSTTMNTQETSDQNKDSNRAEVAAATVSQLDTPDMPTTKGSIAKPEPEVVTTKTADATPSKPATIKKSNYRIIETIRAASIIKKSARYTKQTHTSKAKHAVASVSVAASATPSPSPFDKDGLIKLKGAAWVIQIGSFKNKANALRIVNQLRANGYKAFIQQISTALGDHTRVFVGPENKRTSARALANRLQSEMHIQGIVISYKPLTL